MEPASLDPALASSWSERQVAALLHANLVGLNRRNQEPEAALSSHWDASQNGLNYVFYLRPEARFAGGRQITAKDVLAAWERLFAPGMPPTSSSFLEPVIGYQERLARKSPALTGLQAITSDSLSIRLSAAVPHRNFLSSLSQPAAAIVDTKNATGSPLAGAGYYRISENLTSEGFLTLTANPYFYGDIKPVTRRLEFYLEPDRNDALLDYRSGLLDVLPELPLSVFQEVYGDRKISTGLSSRYLPGAWLLVFPTEGPLARPGVKEALRLSLDRPALAGGADYPLADLLPVKELNDLVAPAGSSYYKQLAVEMLVSEGWFGGKGEPEFNLIPVGGEEAVSLGREVLKQWNLLGIKVSLAEAAANTSGGIFLKRWLTPYPGPEALKQDFPALNIIILSKPNFNLLARPAVKDLEVDESGLLSLGKAWLPAAYKPPAEG